MAETPYRPCSHDEIKWGRKKELIGGKEIAVCRRCREEVFQDQSCERCGMNPVGGHPPNCDACFEEVSRG